MRSGRRRLGALPLNRSNAESTGMKRSLLLTWSLALCASVAMAQHSASVLGAYQAASDGDAGAGGYARYQYDQGPAVAGLSYMAQIGFLTGFGDEASSACACSKASAKLELDLLAFEAGVFYDFAGMSGWVPYAGAGVGFYVPDVSYDSNVGLTGYPGISASSSGDADADTAFGAFALAGVEKAISGDWSLFAEIRYTLLEVSIELVDTVTVSGYGHSLSQRVSAEGDFDLSGIGAALGARYRW